MGYGKDINGRTMRSQKDVIKNYLISTGYSISQEESNRMFGFTRLAARMFDIRAEIEKNEEPYIVCSKIVVGTNSWGEPCRWKEWWIVNKDN